MIDKEKSKNWLSKVRQGFNFISIGVLLIIGFISNGSYKFKYLENTFIVIGVVIIISIAITILEETYVKEPRTSLYKFFLGLLSLFLVLLLFEVVAVSKLSATKKTEVCVKHCCCKKIDTNPEEKK